MIKIKVYLDQFESTETTDHNEVEVRCKLHITMKVQVRCKLHITMKYRPDVNSTSTWSTGQM